MEEKPTAIAAIKQIPQRTRNLRTGTGRLSLSLTQIVLFVFRGAVVSYFTLDQNGEAIITLPDYFQALNRDCRYQLTCIGGFAPVFIAEVIKNNRFKISGGKAHMKISWQITGICHDAYAEAHRIPVEEEKPTTERGAYLYPDAFSHPARKAKAVAGKPSRRVKR